MKLSVLTNPPRLTARQRKLLRWGGFPAGLLVLFLLSLQWTFPYNRVGDAIVSKLGAYYDVSGGKVSAGILPGNFSMSDLTLTTRPLEVEQKPETYKLDELNVKLGVLAALVKHVNVSIEAESGGGSLEATAKLGGGDSRFDIASNDFPLDIFTVFTQKFTGGAPIRGKLNAEGGLKAPGGKWAASKGKVEFECVGCKFGDKGSQLRPMNELQRKAVNGGLTLPVALLLGKCEGKFEVQDGLGVLTVSANSEHGALQLEVEIQFRDPVGTSNIVGFAKFKFSDKLVHQDEKLEAMQMSMIAARLDDGFIGAAIDGTPSNLRVRLSKVDPLDTQSKSKSRRKASGPSARLPGRNNQARVPPPASPTVAAQPAAPAGTPTAGAVPGGVPGAPPEDPNVRRLGNEAGAAAAEALQDRTMRIVDDVGGSPTSPQPSAPEPPPSGNVPEEKPPRPDPMAPPPSGPRGMDGYDQGIPQPPPPDAPPPNPPPPNSGEYR